MSRVVLASFDPVPAPKGASQHILANHRILSRHHEVSLVTLGHTPLDGHRHKAIHIPQGNWIRRAYEFRSRLEEIFEVNEFDVYHVRSPFEGLAVPPGRTTVFEVNGLHSIESAYHYPDVGSVPGIRAKLRAQELVLLDRASAIVTTNPVTQKCLVDLGVSADDIHLVPNVPSFVCPVKSLRQLPPSDRLRCVYIGTLTPWQGLHECLLTLGKMSLPVELTVLTGSGKAMRKPLERLARKKGVTLRWEEPQHGEDLAKVLQLHDVGLAPLVPCERNMVMGCMPVKILDYMAAGLPVLAPNMDVVGTILGPEAPLYERYRRRSMMALLEELAHDPAWRHRLGESNQRRVHEAFSHTVQTEALDAVYARLPSTDVKTSSKAALSTPIG